jgi:hypothetical protein
MMNWFRSDSVRQSLLPLSVLALAVLLVPIARAGATDTNASLANYRKHLENLQTVVAACRQQRTGDACDPGKVGSDDKVQWATGGAAEPRQIRYDWLRDLLSRAGKKEEPQKASAVPVQVIETKPPTIDALLEQARRRIDDDWKQAGAPAPAIAGHATERKSLTAILARKEYQGVSETSAKERFQEWLENVLANLFGHLIRFGYRSPWIAFTLRALLLASLCIGLIWALVRIERRARIRLSPDPRPAANAPSAREWQLWLQDANKMAEQGLWREAIHFLYWASISRLESKRLWPVDRTRTPREYLRLLTPADPRKTNLAALTRSFERTWYGGRGACSSDFQAASKLAAELGVE